MMRTLVKDFGYRGEHFAIVYDGRHYYSVNHKFIGDDGHLVRELFYQDGLHTRETLEDCINETRIDLDIQHYIAMGASKAEAHAIVLDIPLELAEELF